MTAVDTTSETETGLLSSSSCAWPLLATSEKVSLSLFLSLSTDTAILTGLYLITFVAIYFFKVLMLSVVHQEVHTSFKNCSSSKRLRLKVKRYSCPEQVISELPGITQCYLPPDTSERALPSPSQTG